MAESSESKAICRVQGCGKGVRAKELCPAHYTRSVRGAKGEALETPIRDRSVLTRAKILGDWCFSIQRGCSIVRGT